MTRDEALRKAVEAASAYDREREKRRDARRNGLLSSAVGEVLPADLADWQAPDMGHILAALEALGVLKFDEPMPNPRRRVYEDIALSRAIDEAYIAAAIEMRAGAITDALRMRGFKIVRA